MTTIKAAGVPALCTVEEWRTIASMSKWAVYRAIASGRLVAVRVSPRVTLIDVEASMAILKALPQVSRSADARLAA